MFTLLHTNDFHNHLTATQAEILRRMREAVGSQGLLVDAGDAVASGNVTFRPWGETILKTMNLIGYDAMTVGNREFHVSRLGFHCKVGLARFPILCANIHLSRQSLSRQSEGSADNVWNENSDSIEAGSAESNHNDKSQSDPPVLSHIFQNLQTSGENRLKVLIFGLTVPMVTERMTARHASAYLFEDPIETALKLVPQWKDAYNPDLMIALTHIGNRQDQKLAEAVPGIDLIIGGHSHTRLPDGERIGKTLIVQTGCYGHHVGRVEVHTGSELQRPDLHASLIELPKIASEMETETLMSQFQEQLQIGLSPGREITV